MVTSGSLCGMDPGVCGSADSRPPQRAQMKAAKSNTGTLHLVWAAGTLDPAPCLRVVGPGPGTAGVCGAVGIKRAVQLHGDRSSSGVPPVSDEKHALLQVGEGALCDALGSHGLTHEL